MAVTYYALLTTIGAGKLANATALGTTLKLTQLALGDGGGNVPTPDASRTALVNEVRRAPLNQLSIDPANSSQIIAEQVIPEDVGGWWIREMGLYDESGALIAYANCAPSYKPQLAEGSGRTQTVRMVLIVSNSASVELKIDPSVVLATREYVDTAIVTAINRQDAKASVRVATTNNIALNGLLSVDGVVLVAGDRVLVKNQTTGSQNGIYVAGGGAWARSADADENAEVTPALTVSVESGTAQADSVWQLITDAPIIVDTTALVFRDITNGLARLASPAFTGNPTAPTPARYDNDTSIATTEFVQRALGGFASYLGFNTDAVLQQSAVGALVNMAAGIAGYTLTLPQTAGLPDGVSITFINTSGRDNAIARQGADIISITGSSETSVWVRIGENATFTKAGAVWLMTGTAALFRAASFGASQSASGYQRLPGGLIIQWGTILTPAYNTANQFLRTPFAFPISFPNAVLSVGGAIQAGLNAGFFTSWSAEDRTKSGGVFIYSSGTTIGPVLFTYIAIGY